MYVGLIVLIGLITEVRGGEQMKGAAWQFDTRNFIPPKIEEEKAHDMLTLKRSFRHSNEIYEKKRTKYWKKLCVQ